MSKHGVAHHFGVVCLKCRKDHPEAHRSKTRKTAAQRRKIAEEAAKAAEEAVADCGRAQG